MNHKYLVMFPLRLGNLCHLTCHTGMSTLVNCEGPDELSHTATFHQGLHCLPSQNRFLENKNENFRKCGPLPLNSRQTYLTG